MFWGVPTATLDWCEENYVSHYAVAELWNTLSNVAIALPCTIGLQFAVTGKLEARFYAAYASLLIVGLGSAAFHATLLWEAQMMDELPMLYAALVFLFCVADTHYTAKASPWRLVTIAAMLLTAVFTTAIYLYTNNPVVHEVCYGIMVVAMVARSRTMAKNAKDKTLNSMLWVSRVSYFSGFFVWNIDNNACGALTVARNWLGAHAWLWPLAPVTQLHAWWHIGVGIGSYLFILYASAVRAETLGVGFQLKSFWGCPYLVALQNTPHGRKNT